MSLGNAAGAAGLAVLHPWDSPSASASSEARTSAGPDEAERRLQLRAFELWNRLIGSGSMPAIGDFEPGGHPSLSSFGVLFDYSSCSSDPRIAFLGESLAQECGISLDAVERVSDLPGQSLLARIAELYLTNLDSPAPIGFEAEFINQRGRTILYRGILLPFTRSRGVMDLVFGVINWKETGAMALDQDVGADPAELCPRPVGGSA